ncbi:MAG TPA: hypothetical protein VIB39_12985 [Candidatus Angelobacter sp.]|jgi:hypothetical protein
METLTQVPQNGTGTPAQDALPILVTYPETDPTKPAAADEADEMEVAAVLPQKVKRKETPKVFFYTTPPGRVRIVFVSPAGNPTDEVADHEVYTIARGGIYHFNCYFTPAEGAEESTEPVGGTLEVIPHKP